MTSYFIPPDLVVGLEDFISSGCNDIVSASGPHDFRSIQSVLTTAARGALEAGDVKKSKVLWLLADACSMMLDLKNRNQPFKPWWRDSHETSPTPETFTDQDITFFAEILEKIDNSLLLSRLADLTWIRRRSLGHKVALKAIDAYRSVLIEPETWFQTGKRCWGRAIVLAKMLREGSGERITEMKTSLLSEFTASGASGELFACSLAKLIYENGLGTEHYAVLSGHLESLGRHFESEGDYHSARLYFAVARKCFDKQGNAFKSAEMAVLEAEAWVTEAEGRKKATPPSFMAAASLLEKAVATYRSILTKEERHHFGVHDRVIELRRAMEEANSRSHEEMQCFSTEIDLKDMVEFAIAEVKGKPLSQALFAFANFCVPPDVAALKKEALEEISQTPLMSLISKNTISPDGRLVGRCLGMEFSSEGDFEERNARQIMVKMIEVYRRHIHCMVVGYIMPALEILHLEHTLYESNFIGVSHESPIVPIGRATLYGKGLYSGYEKDFATAIHLLVPQIENLVRTHLKNAGEVTTTMEDGVPQEIGLSSLMKRPNVEKIFGREMAFELSALFCDEFGANLRNEIAHGLIGEDACYSVDAVYAWWFSLRIVLNSFWNKVAASGNAPSESAASEDETPPEGLSIVAK